MIWVEDSRVGAKKPRFEFLGIQVYRCSMRFSGPQRLTGAFCGP